MFDGGAINNENIRAAVISVALTPMMIIDYQKEKLYFGMNDRFKINVADLSGKIQNTFSLKRGKRTITDKAKEDRLIDEAKDLAPVELLKRLAKTMPNEMTYFSNIEVHNQLIYVYTSYYGWDNVQQIDIFSPEGQYLYRAFIEVPQEYEIVITPIIKKGYAYVVLENEDGEQSLSKYKIELPKR